MPSDGRSVVVETIAELSRNQRSGGGGGDTDHMDRTSTADSEAGTSSIDVPSDPVQLNSISFVSESDQPATADVVESASCNEALRRDRGDLSGGVDNGPTASTSKGGGGGPSALSESLKYPRKSLPLLPRISQYQRHPLLQVRSGTGLSEFEMLVLEKELFKKRCSVDDHHSSDSAAEPDASASHSTSSSTRGIVHVEERKLIPRSAHYEPHPLLRKSVSGVCELELYLMEKNEEVARRQRGVDCDEGADDVDSDETATAVNTKKSQGRSKLEPRLNQWEKHALLEIKDKAGLSEIDRLFLETEQQVQQQQQQQQERGKCGVECVCKSATCKRCKKQLQHQQNQALKSPSSSLQQSLEAAVLKGDSSKTSEDSSSATSAAPLLSQRLSSGQQKRVHFERQKNDTDDSGIASSDVSCPATRQDDVVGALDVGPQNSNANNRRQLDGKEIGSEETTTGGADDKKNKRAFRTDKQQPGNKSCCMS